MEQFRYLFANEEGETELLRDEALDNVGDLALKCQEDTAEVDGWSLVVYDGFSLCVLAQTIAIANF